MKFFEKIILFAHIRHISLIKIKLCEKSSGVPFVSKGIIFETMIFHAYVIIIIKYCARTYHLTRAFWFQKKFIVFFKCYIFTGIKPKLKNIWILVRI